MRLYIAVYGILKKESDAYLTDKYASTLFGIIQQLNGELLDAMNDKGQQLNPELIIKVGQLEAELKKYQKEKYPALFKHLL